MAKHMCTIGFRDTKEEEPGIWSASITERKYVCDIFRNARRYETGQKVNDDLQINNQFSLVADAYASQNYFAMCYIEFMGSKWKITNVEVQRPRLLLTAGGIYNGEEPEEESGGASEET